MLRRMLVAAALAAGLTASAVAGPWEDGMAAYEAGNHAGAIAIIRPLADDGDARAQFQVGLMYAQGEGVPQDDAEWLRWLQLSVDLGYARALTELALVHVDGVHLPKDWPRAHMYFNLAIEYGDVDAIAINAWLGSQLTPGQTTEAGRLEAEWRAAHGG